jgi:DNA-binding transcriptional ArsR family regulator
MERVSGRVRASLTSLLQKAIIALMVNQLDRTLAALADPTRRRVVELLREQPLPAGELAATAGVTPPAMSRHLRVLRRSGLVEDGGVEHDARIRMYCLRPEPFAGLGSWLGQVQAFWDHELSAFKAYADRSREGDHA